MDSSKNNNLLEKKIFDITLKHLKNEYSSIF